MIATTYRVVTPHGGFEAHWDESDEIQVKYDGSYDAIAYFRYFLELTPVSGINGARIQFDTLQPADLIGFCNLPENGIAVMETMDDTMDAIAEENEEKQRW